MGLIVAGVREWRRGGTVGTPEMTWMTPVRHAIVRDRELPAFVLSHHGADFVRWLVGYEGADVLQRSAT